MALVAAVWLAAIGSGCSDETILMPAGEGNPVKILASIDRFSGILTESGSKTIAADNSYDRSTFVNSDKIRITKKYGGVADNVIEYTLSSGIWTPPSGKALTLQAGATYQAVYPANYTSIQSSQSVATNYLKSNLLRTEILPASSETIDFTFLTGGSVQEIVTLYRPDTNNYTWHGIVYPKGTSTDITVNVTYKNVTYKTTLSGCTLTAGSQYEYTLTIQNNILVPVGSEIKPWTPNQTHTGSLS